MASMYSAEIVAVVLIGRALLTTGDTFAFLDDMVVNE